MKRVAAAVAAITLTAGLSMFAPSSAQAMERGNFPCKVRGVSSPSCAGGTIIIPKRPWWVPRG